MSALLLPQWLHCTMRTNTYYVMILDSGARRMNLDSMFFSKWQIFLMQGVLEKEKNKGVDQSCTIQQITMNTASSCHSSISLWPILICSKSSC